MQSRVVMPTEVDPADVRLLGTVGEGLFGQVRRAVWQSSGAEETDGSKSSVHSSAGDEASVMVAVKRVGKHNADATAKQQLVAEAVLMAQVDHPNVVRLLGCASHSDNTLLMMECCEETSLLTHQRKQRNARATEMQLHCSRPRRCGQWCAFCDAAAVPAEFMQTSLDTVRGMACLASLGHIHRDLTARNVLVARGDVGAGAAQEDCDAHQPLTNGSACMTTGSSGAHAARSDAQGHEAAGASASAMCCKIGDFGLARQLTQGKDYHKSREGLVALRWAAPETVTEQRFSEKSGVLVARCAPG